MGLFSRKPKAIKNLDMQILSARMSLSMYDQLPAGNQEIAKQRIGQVLQEAVQKAVASGHSDQARVKLDEAAKEPPSPEPADMRWSDVIGQARMALG